MRARRPEGSAGGFQEGLPATRLFAAKTAEALVRCDDFESFVPADAFECCCWLRTPDIIVEGEEAAALRPLRPLTMRGGAVSEGSGVGEEV